MSGIGQKINDGTTTFEELEVSTDFGSDLIFS